MILLKKYRYELLLSVVILLLIGNLVTVLRKAPSPVAGTGQLIEAYDRIIEAKDQLITVQEKHREDLRSERMQIREKDSIILKQLMSNQPKYQANEKKYNQIPADVSGLNNGQLRREIAEY